MRFVLAVIKGTLIVNNRKKDELLLELQKKGFKTFNSESDKQVAAAADDNASLSSESTDSLAGAVTSSSPASLDKGYDYLLSMKIWSLTMEKVAELNKQRDAKRTELDLLNAKTAEMLWLDDLDALEAALCRFEGEIEEGKRHEIAARKKAKNDKAAKSKSGAASRQKGKVKGKKHGSDDEDEDDDANASDFEEEVAKRKKKLAAPKPTAASKPTILSSASSSTSSAPLAPKVVPAPSVSASSSSAASAPAAKEKKAEKAVKPLKEKKAAATTASSKPITQFFKKKPAQKDDDDEESFDNDNEVETFSAASSRVPRAAAVAAKTKAVSLYRIDSEDDGDGDEDEQPSFDFIETDSDAESRGYSDIKAIKAAAKKKPPAAKRQLKSAAAPVPSLVALSMPASSTVVGKKGSTAAVKKGTKRGAQNKDSDEDDDVDSENEGDEDSEVEEVKALPKKKKLKKAPSPVKTQSSKVSSRVEFLPSTVTRKSVLTLHTFLKQVIAKPAPKAKPASRKKAPTVVDLDDDDEEDDDGIVDLTSSRDAPVSSRPARQTKQQALKKMAVEASDDDEESEFGESD